MRLSGTEGDFEDKSSPGYRLNKARTTVFSKELALLNGLREHSRYGLFLNISFRATTLHIFLAMLPMGPAVERLIETWED